MIKTLQVSGAADASIHATANIVIAGGYDIPENVAVATQFRVLETFPIDSNTWEVEVRNDAVMGGISWTYTVTIQYMTYHKTITKLKQIFSFLKNSKSTNIVFFYLNFRLINFYEQTLSCIRFLLQSYIIKPISVKYSF